MSISAPKSQVPLTEDKKQTNEPKAEKQQVVEKPFNEPTKTQVDPASPP